MSLDEGAMTNDDAKPITAEWLRDQPWAKETDEESFVIEVDDDCRFRWSADAGLYQRTYNGRLYHSPVNTRGRLRHLLAAFGMEVG